ncbi:MAG TPA: enoyl-CoA hydratase/isomerase family protein, partial [Acidimicrobiales bacterium]|nr:enoyl-CoA hydratase/isomerase family protein [Acidimicrobiales bacterium]
MSAVETTRPRPGVALVTMNRPEALNAMNVDLISGLHDAFDELADDGATRVVVLTGAGRGFCAGADLSGYGRPPGPAAERGGVPAGMAVQRHIASLVPHMRRLPQPIIAAVNGPAAGGGLALVLASDIR